ncbi:FtsW/RodA/SpoVE family cell cycle protein [Bacillus sp. S/N-304-OC-R1]|uniref:FtsW/RodA/SpoVE family cell cycle protein n=1 Tax=Bacillus sp. S/N-304-OC-R1 TaxID=2758034 RepID=UPI001C8DFD1A|nr:FtsW/RodA/SpoVE family cell cycle protein [Bacillus sp. S/N-304-OC-R1]MBY0123757.1 rod shape-determining protein RodA [Bacillus sp. S/N-304-OC-R1]
MNEETNWYRRLDGTILLIIILFSVLSIIFIYSSQQTGQYGSQNFAMKQVINYLIGFTLLILVAKLDVDQIEKMAWPLYIALFMSIVILRFSPESIAYPILGAKRWFIIPFIGSLQPSEFFKIALIIVSAKLISKHNSQNEDRTTKSDLLLIGKLMLVTIPPSLFVYQQPDTGMVFLYFIAIGSMLFLSGIKKRIITFFIVSVLLVLGILVYLYVYQTDVIYKQLIPLLKPHQQERIIGWLDPGGNSDQSYQADRSILAVGSGEMFGKGLLQGNVYIPEKHTDFIFATIAEEGGFVLASIVVTMFFLLIYKVVIIGHSSDTPFGSYICAGVAFSLTAQIFQNIGMVIGIMPVKGISLPFLTSGGSSLFSNMIIMGIILSIRKTFGLYMFSNESKYTEE